MKRMLATIVCWAALTVALMVYAHPPFDIKISFDPATKMLEAVVFHNTSNPDSHYIEEVNVMLNGNRIISHAISREDNNQTQTVRYRIPDARDGDIISVEADCSISGRLEKEITVQE